MMAMSTLSSILALLAHNDHVNELAAAFSHEGAHINEAAAEGGCRGRLREGTSRWSVQARIQRRYQ